MHTADLAAELSILSFNVRLAGGKEADSKDRLERCLQRFTVERPEIMALQEVAASAAEPQIARYAEANDYDYLFLAPPLPYQRSTKPPALALLIDPKLNPRPQRGHLTPLPAQQDLQIQMVIVEIAGQDVLLCNLYSNGAEHPKIGQLVSPVAAKHTQGAGCWWWGIGTSPGRSGRPCRCTDRPPSQRYSVRTACRTRTGPRGLSDLAVGDGAQQPATTGRAPVRGANRVPSAAASAVR